MYQIRRMENTEAWQEDFKWLRTRHIVKEAMGKEKLPDLQSILYLIGIQELGRWDSEKGFTKEEKQDLIHIAVCSLLEGEGYYIFEGRDQDGWPHWKVGKPFTTKGVRVQEEVLKLNIIKYFDNIEIYAGKFEN